MDVKFSRLLIRYRDTHQTLISLRRTEMFQKLDRKSKHSYTPLGNTGRTVIFSLYYKPLLIWLPFISEPDLTSQHYSWILEFFSELSVEQTCYKAYRLSISWQISTNWNKGSSWCWAMFYLFCTCIYEISLQWEEYDELTDICFPVN